MKTEKLYAALRFNPEEPAEHYREPYVDTDTLSLSEGEVLCRLQKQAVPFDDPVLDVVEVTLCWSNDQQSEFEPACKACRPMMLGRGFNPHGVCADCGGKADGFATKGYRPAKDYSCFECGWRGVGPAGVGASGGCPVCGTKAVGLEGKYHA